MRSSLTIFVAVAAITSMTTRADAHAHYRSSIPAADAVIQRAPDALRINFSEGVEPAFSHVGVVGGQGQTVATGPLSTAAGDASVVLVPIRAPMQPGRYQVMWQVTAVDTHRTHGTYTFTLGR
jgi:methionine-rich copper-binding protein CopC